MANIFGVNIETPEEAQRRLLKELQEGMASVGGNAQTKAGYAIGHAISGMFGGRRQQAQNRQAQQEALEIGNKVKTAHLTGGSNPLDAEMAARAAAAAHIRALGGRDNIALANQIRDNMTELMLAKEARDREIDKHRASVSAAESTIAVNERKLFEAKSLEEIESFLARPNLTPEQRTLGEDRFVELTRERDIQDAELKRREEELELRKAQLDEQKKAREFREQELSPRVEQVLLDRQEQSFKSSANAIEYEALADTIDQELVAGGVAAISAEKAKEIFGTEDPTTLLRIKANQIRISQAIDNLPPGVASDKDIELVLSGTVPSTANPQLLATYIRGLAKLERYNAEWQKFSVNYIGEQARNRVANPTIGMLEAWNAGPAENAYKLIEESVTGLVSTPASGTGDTGFRPTPSGEVEGAESTVSGAKIQWHND